MQASQLRTCFRQPIPEIGLAASLLEKAVFAHSEKRFRDAEDLIHQSNMKVIWEWTDSIWGKQSLYTLYRNVPDAPKVLPKELRIPLRMPSSSEKCIIHKRDGFLCRFCGIPVIRKEIRAKFIAAYPKVVTWGRTNSTQHAAFQAMWAQYDHVLPHSRGGDNSIENLLLTCSSCNFGRMSYTLDEVGIADPRLREPYRSDWDGLEKFV